MIWSWEEDVLGIQEELEDKMGEENNQNAFVHLWNYWRIIMKIIIIKELCQDNRGGKREIKIYLRKDPLARTIPILTLFNNQSMPEKKIWAISQSRQWLCNDIWKIRTQLA